MFCEQRLCSWPLLLDPRAHLPGVLLDRGYLHRRSKLLPSLECALLPTRRVVCELQQHALEITEPFEHRCFRMRLPKRLEPRSCFRSAPKGVQRFDRQRFALRHEVAVCVVAGREPGEPECFSRIFAQGALRGFEELELIGDGRRFAC